jgi:hypothetical protein
MVWAAGSAAGSASMRASSGLDAVGAEEGGFKGIKSLESLGVRERRRVRSRGRKQRAKRQTGRGCAERLPDVGPCEPSTTAPKAAVHHLHSKYRSYVFLTEDLALSPTQDACGHRPRIFHTVAAPTTRLSSPPLTRCSHADAWPLPHASTLDEDAFSSRNSFLMLRNTHADPARPTDEMDIHLELVDVDTATELGAVIRAPAGTCCQRRRLVCNTGCVGHRPSRTPAAFRSLCA